MRHSILPESVCGRVKSITYLFFMILPATVMLVLSSWFQAMHLRAEAVSGEGYGTIRGVLLDMDGRPVEGVEIDLEPRSGSEHGRSGFARSDRTGSFMFENLKPGVISLYFRKAGYVELERSFVVREGINECRVVLKRVSDYLPLEPAQESRKVRVSGRVLALGDTHPVKNAVVTIDGSITLSASDGHFILDGVPAGEREMSVVADGYKNWRGKVSVHEKCERFIVRLEKDAGLGSIRGRVIVRARREKEIPPIRVVIGDRVTVTDSAGRFQVDGLTAGNHPVILLYNGREIHSEIIKVREGPQAYELLLEKL